MTKKNDATEAMTSAANEAIEKSQEMFTKSTTATEKFVEGAIEVNASAFKGAEVVAKKAYDNYVANMAASFTDAKALSKASDAAEFFKAASSNYTKAAEKYTAQGKELAELSTKVYKDNVELTKKFYSQAFSAV